MRTYIVTGGAGFIGSWLSESLQKDGHKVVVIDNFDPVFSYSSTTKLRNLSEFHGQVFNYDIRDLDTLNSVFEVYKPDGVFHIAAKAGVRDSIKNPRYYFDVNALGTLNVVTCCMNNGVRNLVYSSSSSVYGERVGTGMKPFKETDSTDNVLSPYAASKRMGELVMRPYADSFDNITCLRFFNVYGPRQRPSCVPHKFLRQIHDDRPITRYGNGESYRDYTHVSDIVRGVIKAMYTPNGAFRTINLGAGSPVKLNDLIELVIPRQLYPVVECPSQQGDVPYTYCDISKAKEELGWEPTMDFKDGMNDFVNWFKENR
jgi:UDP-glucuronate 4-epimerase